MSPTVSDFLVQRLTEWGVERLFGYPGDGINGLLGALQRAAAPAFIQARHEEMAALMACGHAKFTGQVGVCLATSGPGAIHLLNGLYDARLDGQPVVAVVGQAAQAALGGHYQQAVDLPTLFQDVAADVQLVTDPAQARHAIDLAFRTALDRHTVAVVIVPHDVQEQPAVPTPPHEHGTIHSGLGYVPPIILPAPDQLEQAAAVLNAGQRVAMLVGAGALGATDEVVAVAERLGAGVATAMLGWTAVPGDLPYVTGPIGLIGSAASTELMQHCDTLLLVGTSFPYAEYLPVEGQARGVQIDRDGRRISLRYPMEVGLIGDSAPTLQALLPRLRPAADRRWRQSVEAAVARWRQHGAEQAQLPARPLNPHAVFRALGERLDPATILTGDSGTVVSWLAQNVTFQPSMRWSVSGTLATMGSALPYAIAAKFAHPDRPVLALVGDGAMQMSGLNELITIARYWPQWRDPRLVILVVNNGDLGFVSWEQRVLAGNPRWPVSQDLPALPYARLAELLGLAGRRLDRPDEIGAALNEALAAERPIVLEVVIDPDVPPLPLAQLTDRQADRLAQALAQGDTGQALDTVRAFEAKLRTFLPASTPPLPVPSDQPQP